MLEEFDRIRTLVPGATVDDVVLAVCGGAMRGYLEAIGELPASSLSAIVPVHARAGAAADATPGGQPWLRVELGTQFDDLVQRLGFIHGQTAASETAAQTLAARELGGGTHHQSGIALPPPGGRWNLARLFSLHHAPSASCTVTHVPGPSVPLYLDGARMTYFSAIVPISDGMGLVFAVTRYDGRLIISPTSCRELIPDPQLFTQHLRDCFQDYLALAKSAAARSKAAPARSVRRRASASGATRRPGPKAGTASTAPRAARAGRPRSAAPAG
jgi:diacylglycerol O-acyltransferase / wax synthase